MSFRDAGPAGSMTSIGSCVGLTARISSSSKLATTTANSSRGGGWSGRRGSNSRPLPWQGGAPNPPGLEYESANRELAPPSFHKLGPTGEFGLAPAGDKVEVDSDPAPEQRCSRAAHPSRPGRSARHQSRSEPRSSSVQPAQGDRAPPPPQPRRTGLASWRNK